MKQLWSQYFNLITSAIFAKAGWTESNCEGNGLDVPEPLLEASLNGKEINQEWIVVNLNESKQERTCS